MQTLRAEDSYCAEKYMELPSRASPVDRDPKLVSRDHNLSGQRFEAEGLRSDKESFEQAKELLILKGSQRATLDVLNDNDHVLYEALHDNTASLASADRNENDRIARMWKYCTELKDDLDTKITSVDVEAGALKSFLTVVDPTSPDIKQAETMHMTLTGMEAQLAQIELGGNDQQSIDLFKGRLGTYTRYLQKDGDVIEKLTEAAIQMGTDTIEDRDRDIKWWSGALNWLMAFSWAWTLFALFLSNDMGGQEVG